MEMRCLLLLVVLFPTWPGANGEEARPSVLALMAFGDSLVDVGNNDYILTVSKANLPPYGRDFKDHVATGRFCNGKLIIDIIAENLGFAGSPPAYLSPEASGLNLLIGANFASAGAGYHNPTLRYANVISLSQQLEYFREYQSKLSAFAVSSHSQSIISGSLYVIVDGTNDLWASYKFNPLLYKTQTVDQFSDRLIGIFQKTVMELYIMGARRIGVASLPPLGCLPLAITVFGHGSNRCVPRLNSDAQRFNLKLSTAVNSVSKLYRDMKIVVLDFYTPLYSLSTSPGSQGFTEARRGCCGTGLVESTVFLCNPKSIGTCPNATTYVFWDSVHPSEAANQVYIPEWIYENINAEQELQSRTEMVQEEKEIVRKLGIVALWCIQWNPKNRPSMPQVLNMLTGGLQVLTMPPKPFVSSPGHLMPRI